MPLTKKQQDLLFQILSIPTAPFREHLVSEFCQKILEGRDIPFFIDRYGNIVVGVSGREQYQSLLARRSREPVRLFVAHMDHPGFHGLRWLKNGRLLVKWHGGSPVKHLAASTVWLVGEDGIALTGKLTKPQLVKSRRAIKTAEIILTDLPDGIDRPKAASLFGGFDFRAPVWTQRGRIYTRAADDLAGVFAILDTASWVFSKKDKGSSSAMPFLGLLTRAEEVGFIGAIGHFKLGWTKAARRPFLVVSLEASRTLTGAEIGKGPVVRLGDRRTVYDQAFLKILSDVAGKKLKGKHQKRIMDGGWCEAAAATAMGLPAIGITIPLGNYHNEGFEGGPDCRGSRGPAPEIIHARDVEGELALCRGLMETGLPWKRPWGDLDKKLRKHFTRYQDLL